MQAVCATEAARAAYRLLLEQPQRTVPIRPEEFALKDCHILSFEDYARLAGIPPAMLCADYDLSDGYLACGLPQGSIILYNAQQPITRARFTVAHELGHLTLGHHTMRPDACAPQWIERQADLFAAQLLMPNPLARLLAARGAIRREQDVMRLFGVGHAAARRCLRAIARPRAAVAPEDDRLAQRLCDHFYAAWRGLTHEEPAYPDRF